MPSDHPQSQRPLWDCHAHPFGKPGEYPVSSAAAYAIPDTPFSAYEMEAMSAGVTHSVLVQPSAYGSDNRALLDRLRSDPVRYRAIIAPEPDLDVEKARNLHKLGVRGVRLNLLSPGGNGMDSVLSLKPILQELGWHVAAHLDATRPEALEDLVARLEVPIVLDHMGRPPLSAIESGLAAFAPLLRLVSSGKVWVKLSAPYQFSREPDFADVKPLALKLLEANEERILFGSNWPHIGTSPSPGTVLQFRERITQWLSSTSFRPEQVFSANADRLYQ